MHSAITSYLLQTNECALPYIGLFTTEYVPAVNDAVNNQLLPSKEEIFFKEEIAPVSPGLINYIALKNEITRGEAGNLLDNFCKKWKEKIEHGEVLCFDSFGCLQKSDSGAIYFTQEAYSVKYHQPIQARKMRDESASLIAQENDNYTTHALIGKPVKRKRWQVLAFILALLALITLIFSFYNQKLSVTTFGNRNHFIIKDAGETHVDLPK